MKWNDETKAEAVQMRESGATYAAIGLQFGFSADAVAGMVRRYYEPKKIKRPPSMTAEEISQAVEMRDNGAAFDVIGREIQRSPDLVSRTLTGMGYGKIMPAWTADMESTARTMWNAGSSAPHIASVVGVSVSAVSNKITRMGLDGRNGKRYRSARVQKRDGAETGTWDARVFEPWSVYRARRMAERQKMREMCDA